MKAKTEEELNMLATYSQANTELLKAVEIVRDLNADEFTRKRAEIREKYWRDYKSSIKEAEIRGEARGEARGIERQKGKEKREIAIKSLSEGLEPSLISKLTNLSIEEIKSFKSEM
jgi:predicted transposase YdaD